MARKRNLPAGDLSDTARSMFRGERLPESIELGIHEQSTFPGDHIAYFWETDADFLNGVAFLEVGLRNGDHCVIFGHDEANARVRRTLAQSFDCAGLEKSGHLSILSGDGSPDVMFERIVTDFQQALASGSKLLRLLGNIGWGQPGWPDENAILEFEAKVTGAVRDVPAVLVCMYDVRSTGGRAMFRGAFETHPLTICRNILRENPHYVPAAEFVATLPPRE